MVFYISYTKFISPIYYSIVNILHFLCKNISVANPISSKDIRMYNSYTITFTILSQIKIKTLFQFNQVLSDFVKFKKKVINFYPHELTLNNKRDTLTQIGTDIHLIWNPTTETVFIYVSDFTLGNTAISEQFTLRFNINVTHKIRFTFTHKMC